MKPFVASIEKLTTRNNNFRHVLFTGLHEQLVLMCLQPGEELGREIHADVDQFFRIEEGDARFVLGAKDEHLVTPATPSSCRRERSTTSSTPRR
jgi:mannose-6-phosphate isomerase-like protein (cupin superfamily)